MKAIRLAALFLFTILLVNSYAQKVIKTDSVKAYVGKEVTVKGTVSEITVTKSGLTYLNIDGKFPDNKFTALVFKRDAEPFGDLKVWEKKKIEITGKIEDYKGKPQIVLTKPDQIKAVK
jgi:DNA/RNA endonuclease YhcR with UshA esterase domain